MAVTRLGFCGSSAAYAGFSPKTEAEAVAGTALSGLSGYTLLPTCRPLWWDEMARAVTAWTPWAWRWA